ncbi:MAG: hypothetical protein IPG60_07525 [Bacteroidetes bacterium]|nr:hypothetical protein [Bacteroidota bacterium]
MNLLGDSSFSYIETYDINSRTSSGMWKLVNDNTIVLNSYLNIESLPLVVIEKSSKEQNTTKLSYEFTLNPLDNIDEEDIKLYSILINDQILIHFDQNLNTIVNTSDTIRKFQIFIHPNNIIFTNINETLSTSLYYVQNVKANNFSITIPFSISTIVYESINSDTLILKNKMLYWNSRGIWLEKR